MSGTESMKSLATSAPNPTPARITATSTVTTIGQMRRLRFFGGSGARVGRRGAPRPKRGCGIVGGGSKAGGSLTVGASILEARHIRRFAANGAQTFLGDQTAGGHDHGRVGEPVRRLRSLLPRAVRGRAVGRDHPDARPLPPVQSGPVPLY